MISDKPFTFDRVIRIGITLLIVYGAYLFVSYIQEVLIPFAIAAILAYFVHPLVSFYQYRCRIKYRAPAVLLALLSVLIVFAGLLALLIPLIVSEVRQMAGLLSNLSAVQNLEARIQTYLPEDISVWVADMTQRQEVKDIFNTEKLSDYALTGVKTVIPGIWNFFSGAVNFILGLVGLAVIALYLIFILLDYEKVMQGWKALVAEKYRDRVVRVVEDFEKAMATYFRAQGLIAFCVGILFAIGFSIIGLPLGILFGLLVGVLNLVPYLQTVAIVPAAFLALTRSLETGENFWALMGLVLLIFAVVQLIQDAVLTPRIMGKATGLNPAAMLLALSVWGKILGFLGLIIALPITFLLLSYYKDLIGSNKAMLIPEEAPALESPPAEGDT